MSLYAGVCRTDITPPPGVWMCGYAFRNTGAVGVHDPLHATALVFDNGDRRVGIVSLDLIALGIELVASIREKVSETVGIAPDALMLHCTHTHGGPNVAPLNAMGEYDQAYMSVMERKIVGAIEQASRSMIPVRLSAGEAPVQIGINRRQRSPAYPQPQIEQH